MDDLIPEVPPICALSDPVRRAAALTVADKWPDTPTLRYLLLVLGLIERDPDGRLVAAGGYLGSSWN